ncbi:hypothetical protein STEG23_003338 [Scotinomys teguina]
MAQGAETSSRFHAVVHLPAAITYSSTSLPNFLPCLHSPPFYLPIIHADTKDIWDIALKPHLGSTYKFGLF